MCTGVHLQFVLQCFSSAGHWGVPKEFPGLSSPVCIAMLIPLVLTALLPFVRQCFWEGIWGLGSPESSRFQSWDGDHRPVWDCFGITHAMILLWMIFWLRLQLSRGCSAEHLGAFVLAGFFRTVLFSPESPRSLETKLLSRKLAKERLCVNCIWSGLETPRHFSGGGLENCEVEDLRNRAAFCSTSCRCEGPECLADQRCCSCLVQDDLCYLSCFSDEREAPERGPASWGAIPHPRGPFDARSGKLAPIETNKVCSPLLTRHWQPTTTVREFVFTLRHFVGVHAARYRRQNPCLSSSTKKRKWTELHFFWNTNKLRRGVHSPLAKLQTAGK